MAIPPNYCLFQGVRDMETEDKTREQLLDELAALRQRVAELETSEAERKQMEEVIRESERQYRLLAENAEDVIWTVDMNMRPTYMSPSITRLLGYTVEEAMAKPMEAVYTPASFETAMKVLAEELAIENMEQKNLSRSRTLELELNCKDGSIVPVEAKFTFIREPDGRPFEILAIARDITERKQAEETIKQLAYYDTVTGLPNRALLNDRIHMALTHARRDKQKLAIMMLDLDRFKDINDTLGHSVGDQLLRSVGNRLGNLLRASDTISRIGGDEFIVLLPNIARDKDTVVVAEKIMKAFQKPFMLDKGEHYYITTSIGIVAYPKHGEDAETLLKNADVAMYRAKEQGRDQWQWSTAD